jgi:hypothetical protein
MAVYERISSQDIMVGADAISFYHFYFACVNFWVPCYGITAPQLYESPIHAALTSFLLLVAQIFLVSSKRFGGFTLISVSLL